MKPRTRKENYLAKIAKDPDAVEMTPKTRTEHYLNEIAENGGGGSEDDKTYTVTQYTLTPAT